MTTENLLIISNCIFIVCTLCIYNVIVYITCTFSFNILGNIRDFNLGKVMYNIAKAYHVHLSVCQYFEI